MSDLPKKLFVACVGVLSGLYLFNPTLGVLEFIPDGFPVVGNLDEAAATTLLIASLAYFGMDVTRLFGGQSAPAQPGKEEKAVDGKVVEP